MTTLFSLSIQNLTAITLLIGIDPAVSLHKKSPVLSYNIIQSKSLLPLIRGGGGGGEPFERNFTLLTSWAKNYHHFVGLHIKPEGTNVQILGLIS